MFLPSGAAWEESLEEVVSLESERSCEGICETHKAFPATFPSRLISYAFDFSKSVKGRNSVFEVLLQELLLPSTPEKGLKAGEGELGRERESYEGEFVRGSQRLLQTRIQVVFPDRHPCSLVALKVSSSVLILGSLPALGGSKRSWVLCLLQEEAKGVGFSAYFRRKQKEVRFYVSPGLHGQFLAVSFFTAGGRGLLYSMKSCKECLEPLRSETTLNLLHFLGANLKGFGENIVWNWRRSGEKGGGDGLRAWKLAVKAGNNGGGFIPIVLLEMDEAAGEDEDFSDIDGFGYEFVCGGDEAHVEGAVKDEHGLGGARVRVGWVETAGCVVYAGQGNSQSVQPRNLLNVRDSHNRPQGVIDHCWLRQAFEGEATLLTVVEVGDTDILERVGVGGEGSGGSGEEEDEEKWSSGGCHGSEHFSSSRPPPDLCRPPSEFFPTTAGLLSTTVGVLPDHHRFVNHCRTSVCSLTSSGLLSTTVGVLPDHSQTFVDHNQSSSRLLPDFRPFIDHYRTSTCSSTTTRLPLVRRPKQELCLFINYHRSSFRPLPDFRLFLDHCRTFTFLLTATRLPPVHGPPPDFRLFVDQHWTSTCSLTTIKVLLDHSQTSACSSTTVELPPVRQPSLNFCTFVDHHWSSSSTTVRLLPVRQLFPDFSSLQNRLTGLTFSTECCGHSYSIEPQLTYN
ncbi:hypothetical protein M5K25_011134 [Dendrobium thyrsiflorum]|uniref:Uncharacterized protein n=1 Tax=Dendrobium thyrsiflorum TaxID=117978 RepID=A0ABD0V295_DENTH